MHAYIVELNIRVIRTNLQSIFFLNYIFRYVYCRAVIDLDYNIIENMSATSTISTLDYFAKRSKRTKLRNLIST
jgi:hypothetical protein